MQKNNFRKEFLKLMNNATFAKTIENLTNHRNTKLVTTKPSRNYLVSEPTYYTKAFFLNINS